MIIMMMMMMMMMMMTTIVIIMMTTTTTKSIVMMIIIACQKPLPFSVFKFRFSVFNKKIFFFFGLWNTFSRMSELVQKRQRSPWLWYDALYNLMPSGREHSKCLKILHGFTNKVSTIHNSVSLDFLKQEVPV